VLCGRPIPNPTKEPTEVIEVSVDYDVDLVLHPDLVRERGKQTAGASEAGDSLVSVVIVMPTISVHVIGDE
jgi:hypothetical protein